MATVIDALVVTLGLDPSKFVSGSKSARQALHQTSEEAQKAAQDIEARGKQAAAFFSKLRNEALALVAIFTAGVGIKSFVGDTITGAASLGLMAKNLDMSTQSLDAWQKANRRTGGTAEGMAAQLKESADALANVKMGRGSEAATEFYRMGGVDVRNFKTGNEFLLARSKIIADMYAKDPTKAVVEAGRMGISEDTFNLLKQGPAAVMKLVDAQRKNSQVTEEQAAAALALINRWQDFKDRINTVTTQIVLQLEPAIARLIGKLQSLADWVASHQDDIARWVDSAVDGITRFARAADDAAQSVGGWKVVLGALLALKLAGLVTGLLSLAGALAGVGTSLGIISKLGPAALIVLAGVTGATAGYKGAEALDKTLPKDAGPIRQDEHDEIGWTNPEAIPSVKELALRTLASRGNAPAAKSLYKLTGRNDYPASWTPDDGATVRPKEVAPKYKPGEGGSSEMWDRTLASLGNKPAARRIRDATGVDSYLVGPDPEPEEDKPAKYKPGEGGFAEKRDRVLAKMGNKSAGRRIRDATGVDDYNVGDSKEPERKSTASKATLFLDLEDKYKLPSGLLDRMWKRESNRGDPKYMLSSKGAEGHFGFMKPTAKEYGLKDPSDLEESAGAAARMMSDLLRRNGGDLDRALAAYNWGQGKLNEFGMDKRPRETLKYTEAVNPKPKTDQPEAPGKPTAPPVRAIDQRTTVINAATPPATRGGAQGPNVSTSKTEVTTGNINIYGVQDVDKMATGAASAIDAKIKAAQSNTGLD